LLPTYPPAVAATATTNHLIRSICQILGIYCSRQILTDWIAAWRLARFGLLFYKALGVERLPGSAAVAAAIHALLYF
jgi:hypothetical protein